MRSLLPLLTIAVACGGSTVPPIHPAADPVADELHLVAFAPDAVLIVERVVGPRPSLELVALRPAARARIRAADLHDELARWPGAAGVIGAIWNSDLGATLESLGFSRPESCGNADRIETPYGTLFIGEREVRLTDGQYTTVVAELADRDPVERTWFGSGDGRWAAVSLAYDGSPSTRDLRVVALEPAAGQLAALRAFDHHQRAEYETALGLWEDAVRLDPSNPRSHYNLACAYARNGQPNSAISLLRSAIELGGDRFRKLAERDADLDSLRGNAFFEQILRRERPTPETKCPWEIPVITCD